MNMNLSRQIANEIVTNLIVEDLIPSEDKIRIEAIDLIEKIIDDKMKDFHCECWQHC